MFILKVIAYMVSLGGILQGKHWTEPSVFMFSLIWGIRSFNFFLNSKHHFLYIVFPTDHTNLSLFDSDQSFLFYLPVSFLFHNFLQKNALIPLNFLNQTVLYNLEGFTISQCE